MYASFSFNQTNIPDGSAAVFFVAVTSNAREAASSFQSENLNKQENQKLLLVTMAGVGVITAWVSSSWTTFRKHRMLNRKDGLQMIQKKAWQINSVICIFLISAPTVFLISMKNGMFHGIRRQSMEEFHPF